MTGIRGILTVDGKFHECEYGCHGETINSLGVSNCIGSVIFFKSNHNSALYKSDTRIKLSEQQKEWLLNNKDYFSEEQLIHLDMIMEFETVL